MYHRLIQCVASSLLIAAQASIAQSPGVPPAAAGRSDSVKVSGAPTRRDSVISYDSSALRIESHWGDSRVVQGVQGKVLGTLGLFRSLDIEEVVARSPVAAAEARIYKINYRQGEIVGSIGVTAFIAGLFLSGNTHNNASTPILIIAGAAATLWGGQHLNTAFTALSRAVWWYNRDLPR